MQWFKLEDGGMINLEHVTRLRYGAPEYELMPLEEDESREVATVHLVDGSQVEISGRKVQVLFNLLDRRYSGGGSPLPPAKYEIPLSSAGEDFLPELQYRKLQ